MTDALLAQGPHGQITSIKEIPAREAHEHIFQARLPRGQVFKLRATAVNFIQQHRNRHMRFTNVK